MPSFRFSKAFGITRDVKVFLNLESGFTRGTVPPDVARYEEQAENLRNVRRHVREQRKKLKNKNREIFQLTNELRAVKERLESALDAQATPQVAAESETGALPDFVIIGARKCGTTSLYDLLTRHPHVERAALKELHYFDNRFDKGIDWYRAQFPPPRWKDGRRSITGEASAKYLADPLVPERMAKVVPQARLIVLLRNPVDRAYSAYQAEVRNGHETRRFEEAIAAEKELLLGKEDGAPEHKPRAMVSRPPYLKTGIYVEQLLRWSKFFSDEQMLVLKSEDFFERELYTLKLVLDFLDLPDWQPEASKILNKGSYKQEMDPGTRQQLEAFFEPYNQRLYEYLGMDFGW